MSMLVTDACLWLLIAVFLQAAAEKQSNLVCSQTPALVKAGLREGAFISCRLVNFDYTNSTYVIWSFVSRSSAGDNVVVLRDGQRKSYYQAIHSDQFPTLDIGRITADTLLYPLYNVTVIQEAVPVLKSEFSLRAVGMDTTSKSPTLNPSSFEASPSGSTVPTTPPSPQSLTRTYSGDLTTESQQVFTGTPSRIPFTGGNILQPMATVPQASAVSRIVQTTDMEITVPTIKQTKASTFFPNYRTAGDDYDGQSTSRILTDPQGRTSTLTIAVQPNFQCNQLPSIATVGVGKDVAITCRLSAAKWTDESYVSWTFNTPSPKYGYHGVTLKDGQRMYAAEAIKDEHFPTLFMSRVTEDLLAFPDFKVTFYNGTKEVVSTVYTTRIQGAISKSTQPPFSPELSISTTAAATVISTDWHSTHLDTDLARSREPQTDITSHLTSSTAAVVPAFLTNAASPTTPVPTVAKTVSLLSTNALASETQHFLSNSPGTDSSAPHTTSPQPAITNDLIWLSATTVDMTRSAQITLEKSPSSGIPMFSVTERTSPTAAISPSASLNTAAGSAREDMRTTADSTAATTKSVLSALSSYAPTHNVPSLSSSTEAPTSLRATTIFSLFSNEAPVPSTRLSDVRLSEPESTTPSQAMATAASLTATNAYSSSSPSKDSAPAMSTPLLPQDSSVTSSVRSVAVASLPITTKLVVILATSSSIARQQLSTEASTASPNSPTILSSNESAASTTIADATLSRLITSWSYAAHTSDKLTNMTPSSLPHRNTVDGELLQTMTNSAAPTVASATVNRWTAARNSSVATPLSMSAEGTPQDALPRVSTLTAASTLIVTLPPLSSAQSLSPSTSYITVNSGVTSTPSSGIESLTSSAAVRTASTTGNQTTLFFSLVPSALNLTRNASTVNFFESSSTTLSPGTLAKSPSTTYSGTTQGSQADNASREMMPSGTISILTSASKVPASTSYVATSVSSSLPTSPSSVGTTQIVAQAPTASDSRTLTAGVLPEDSGLTAVPTKVSSSGPTSQKPSTIEIQSTKRVLSTLRQTTKGIKPPQGDYASGASSCLLSHVAILTSLMVLLRFCTTP